MTKAELFQFNVVFEYLARCDIMVYVVRFESDNGPIGIMMRDHGETDRDHIFQIGQFLPLDQQIYKAKVLSCYYEQEKEKEPEA